MFYHYQQVFEGAPVAAAQSSSRLDYQMADTLITEGFVLKKEAKLQP